MLLVLDHYCWILFTYVSFGESQVKKKHTTLQIKHETIEFILFNNSPFEYTFPCFSHLFESEYSFIWKKKSYVRFLSDKKTKQIENNRFIFVCLLPFFVAKCKSTRWFQAVGSRRWRVYTLKVKQKQMQNVNLVKTIEYGSFLKWNDQRPLNINYIQAAMVTICNIKAAMKRAMLIKINRFIWP